MKNYNSHVYDKAKWHYGAEDFPIDAPIEYGFTHTGFFVTWLAERQLLSHFAQENSESIVAVLDREKSPIHLYELWDGCLIGELLSDGGNRFSFQYYEKHYFSDYVNIFGEDASVYNVDTTWKNYDQLKPTIDKRYNKWLRSSRKRKWKFWA